MTLLPGSGFEKAVRKFLPGAQKQRERFLLYLRLYTHAVRAMSGLNNADPARALLHIQIVAQLSERTRDYPEEELIKRIHSVSELLIAQWEQIAKAVKKGNEQGQTQLLMIQNLCTLRLLRLLTE